MKRLSLFTCGAVAVAAMVCGPSPASAQKLPETMTFTAYDTGTSGFNITVAVGKAFKEKAGTDIRVLPAGNDVARLAPLKAGRAQVSSMGVGTFFAMEGLVEFATKEWGPQALQLILTSIDCNGGGLATAADANIKTMKDLKGKRVGFVVGSPALNQNTLAMMAFAGLTTADVKSVEFASYGAMWKGLVNNDVDAAFGSTVTGPAKEAETSPRGIFWPPVPHSDKEGWARLVKIGPYFIQHKATCGAGGISPEKPLEMGSFPYPIYTVYASMSEDMAYGITKTMISGYDIYKDAVPGASGLGADKQTKNYVLPFHPGAIKALKEAGQWSASDQAHADKLYARQKVLGEAWAGFMKTSPPDDKDAFRKAWMEARKAALTKAGMETIID
ncbi:MAG TPA: TAXI family TRAP transporter solute-binding subunit [Hyphomicrobiaceae bacterium]|nr:TAXI family TRAP transporter solute-binding subunit [Hyphomicrobiaceae bacterium]